MQEGNTGDRIGDTKRKHTQHEMGDGGADSIEALLKQELVYKDDTSNYVSVKLPNESK